LQCYTTTGYWTILSSKSQLSFSLPSTEQMAFLVFKMEILGIAPRIRLCWLSLLFPELSKTSLQCSLRSLSTWLRRPIKRSSLQLEIAMTLSWTRPYPDPTRYRVGSDLSKVPVGLSWAGLISTFVGVHPHPIMWPGLYWGCRPHQSYMCATPPSTFVGLEYLTKSGK
jgi:hypothetical protein